MFYAVSTISVVCKIRFLFQLNLANASVCDRIKPRSIKYICSTGTTHWELLSSFWVRLMVWQWRTKVTRLPALPPEAVMKPEENPYCKENKVLIRVCISHLHFLPQAEYQRSPLVKTKITPAGVCFFSTHFLSL